MTNIKIYLSAKDIREINTEQPVTMARLGDYIRISNDEIDLLVPKEKSHHIEIWKKINPPLG